MWFGSRGIVGVGVVVFYFFVRGWVDLFVRGLIVKMKKLVGKY